MPLWINHSFEKYTKKNKQITQGGKERAETREHWEFSVSFRSSLIRNSHFPSIQPLYTPWWRLWSNNLPLGKASRPSWWWLRSLGTGGSPWKALKKGCQKAVWNIVKWLVAHFRQVLCRCECLRCSNSHLDYSVCTLRIFCLYLFVKICCSWLFMCFLQNIFKSWTHYSICSFFSLQTLLWMMVQCIIPTGLTDLCLVHTPWRPACSIVNTLSSFGVWEHIRQAKGIHIHIRFSWLTWQCVIAFLLNE